MPENPWRNMVYALLAVVAGGGGSVAWNTVIDPRPDAYTGNDGLRDKMEIMRRLERKRDDIEELRLSLHRLELEIHDIRRAPCPEAQQLLWFAS